MGYTHVQGVPLYHSMYILLLNCAALSNMLYTYGEGSSSTPAHDLTIACKYDVSTGQHYVAVTNVAITKVANVAHENTLNNK